MKKIFFSIISFVIFLFIGYYILIFISNEIGWYGYRYWENRGGTTTIQDSKERKVFVKTLNFKIIDSSNLKGFHFLPYIEKGFKYGKHSIDETVIKNHSNYPYNLSYERNKNDSIALDIFPEDRKKLDSSDVNWGFLKKPYLNDTIRIQIVGAKDSKGRKKSGIIKIW